MKLNQRGFTLVEVIIAIGIISVISLGLMSLMQNMSKANKTATAKQEQMILHQQVYDYFKRKDYCELALQGKKIPQIGLELSELKRSTLDSTPYIMTGRPLQNGVTITRISVKRPSLISNAGKTEATIRVYYKMHRSIPITAGARGGPTESSKNNIYGVNEKFFEFTIPLVIATATPMYISYNPSWSETRQTEVFETAFSLGCENGEWDRDTFFKTSDRAFALCVKKDDLQYQILKCDLR